MSAILVAYFSATGITAGDARIIAETVKGDIFEIRPTIAYTPADLDWHDNQSRSSLEMKDEASRPEISGKVEDMGKYGTIFLGFPVWWYAPPRIINSFLEGYDFSGKAIAPFVTSGSSPLGKIPQILEHLCPDAHWLPGIRFGANASRNEISAWAKEHTDWQTGK